MYVGRFAPSPSGPLHFGSLVAALGSFLQAKHNHGRWLVRVEDLDTPRNQRDAASSILQTLAAFGLTPDDEVLYQSTRLHAYRAALLALREKNLSFPCACSRQTIGDGVYTGTCRHGIAPGRRARAVRLRVDTRRVAFEDAVQGAVCQDLEREVGDFVVLRADNIVAYHLAVVIDDDWQGVTEVVRGADLLDSTPRQIHLQQLMGLSTPNYVHLPVAVTGDGRKLSKQNGAPALDPGEARAALFEALRFLGQRPPAALRYGAVAALLAWATENWTLARVPRVPQIDFNDRSRQTA